MCKTERRGYLLRGPIHNRTPLPVPFVLTVTVVVVVALRDDWSG